MPKISEARREARRGEILDAALRCFTRSGYQKTSMADIIAESGMSAGAIYLYFSSKADLVRAVAARVLDTRRIEIEAAGADGPVSPAAIVRIIAEGVRAGAPLPVLVQVWGEATTDDALRERMQETVGHMRSTIRDALERWARAQPEREATAGEWADLVAPVVVGMLPGFILQCALVDGFDQEKYLRGLDGLLPTG